MNDITIPCYFLKGNDIVLSANEVDYAIQHELIYLKDLGEIVDISLSKYPNDENLLKLALNLLLDSFHVDTDVRLLSSTSHKANCEPKSVSNKWRYILLLWLYENRKNSSADYDRINTVYADFDYPVDMERLINYMPTHSNTEKLGYDNILHNWKNYLDTYRHLIES